MTVPEVNQVIQQTVVLPAPPQFLFDAYLDASAHAAFTGAPAIVAPRPGADFSAFGGILTGRILALVGSSVIVQSWRSTAFKPQDPDSTLILAFSTEAQHGRIDLVHLNVPEHDYEGVTAGWPQYYWGPWRTWLEKPHK